MRALSPGSVDVIVADPPFGISFNGKESLYNRDGSLVIEGYREILEDYDRFTRLWIGEIPRLLRESGSAWVFSGWTNLADVLNAAREARLTLVNHMIWRYQFGVFTRRKFVTSHYHLLFLVKNPDEYYFNKIEHYPLDVWTINRTYMRGQVKNGTKLPDELVMRCIDFSSRPGALILDPFMGNGTTAVAAKGSYRHFVGFEINSAMKAIIDDNLRLMELGGLYTPYAERTDPLVERARARHRVSGEKSKGPEHVRGSQSCSET
ncbi:MAG: site-specific DNA-methyltransferase [Candidatus Thorarchaeota archaeon]|nr:site-specific DNA-methyltransferase [Candidatus Thorarchaeota archaeon]